MATSEPRPLRIEGFPGVPRGRGFVLAEAVSATDGALGVVVLAVGATPRRAALTPEGEVASRHLR